MFIQCSEKKGTAYFEFQYCKKEWNIKKLLRKGFSFWEKDSLLVHVDNDRDFFENYGDYLKAPNAHDGTQVFDPFGVNYYTKEQALSILERIRADRPRECDDLILWLEKAATDYKGFFFLGI